MIATTAMEVNAEARRILAVSISKLYASRSQRGGLRLHRSLLLSLVMRSARDIYHSSREIEMPCAAQPTPEPMETSSSSPAGEQIVPESQPELQTSEESESGDEGCEEGDITEDKENMSPTKQSRKRRGKAAAAPDFLPIKRARLEPGEERHAAPHCRGAESLSALSLNLNRAIAAF
ncbi:immediate early response gene 2 protein-like [Notothenia coriiceps]|uniref:Immediate early response gene 2 protein-like n=1 Tax=Notothenia coriiceps TaxID=8208 RepID=A0A6I9PCD1_9TELE|nr:PREDICTED: immediate early response gene 2 protein-like [Notothenia coriiceps]